MADDEILDDDSGDVAGLPASGGRSKIVTILLWAAGFIVAVLLMILISYMMAKKVRNDAYREDQNIVIAPAPPPLSNFSFQNEFRVNTADADEAHFIQLKLTFAYEPQNAKLETELIQRQQQMMHIINLVLGGKRKEDISTQQQKINLAEEIKAQINMILRDGKIEDVYFQELVVS